MRFFIDTSVLLRLRTPADPQYAACVEMTDQLRTPSCDAVIGTQVLIEYWAVATRPLSANGLALTAAEVSDEFLHLSLWAPLLPEPADIFWFWSRLVVRFDVKGRPTHDARLVALMDAHGITGLITLNKGDFTRYPHIAAFTPQEWLDANPTVP